MFFFSRYTGTGIPLNLFKNPFYFIIMRSNPRFTVFVVKASYALDTFFCIDLKVKWDWRFYAHFHLSFYNMKANQKRIILPFNLPSTTIFVVTWCKPNSRSGSLLSLLLILFFLFLRNVLTYNKFFYNAQIFIKY